MELLKRSETSLNSIEVSRKTGLKARSANMHLLGLIQLGYASKSENGYYGITESGREAIRFSKVDKVFAAKVLRKTSPEKAFHFYRGIDQPTGVSSSSLVDFREKIRTIDIESIEFHAVRGDFELWVHYLGDIELSKRLRLIRQAGLTGEALRDRLHKTLGSRCDELQREKLPS